MECGASTNSSDFVPQTDDDFVLPSTSTFDALSQEIYDSDNWESTSPRSSISSNESLTCFQPNLEKDDFNSDNANEKNYSTTVVAPTCTFGVFHDDCGSDSEESISPRSSISSDESLRCFQPNIEKLESEIVGQHGWSCPVEERRIVLLGRAGSGKSASGNNILGKSAFQSSVCGSSVTKKCRRGTGTRYGRNVQIIDSPGLFDTDMSNTDITREIVKCVGMTAPGLHAFVLVVKIDRFTEEEQKTVDHLIKVFGEGMLNYLLVLFTKKDDLIYEMITLQDYLERVPEHLKNFLRACHNRCIAFNNRGSETEREQDVQEFLNMIDQILLDNGGNCYTSEIFMEAEMNILKREEQLRREHEMKRQKEIEEIRKSFERKWKFEKEQHDYNSKQFQERIKQLEEENKKSRLAADVIRIQVQEVAWLKAALKDMLDARNRANMDMEAERKREEEKSERRWKGEKQNLRHVLREEINMESPEVMELLMLMVSIISHTLPEPVDKIPGMKYRRV